METRARAAVTQREAEEPQKSVSFEASNAKLKQGGLKTAEGSVLLSLASRLPSQSSGATGKNVAATQEPLLPHVFRTAATDSLAHAANLFSLRNTQQQETLLPASLPREAESSTCASSDGVAALRQLETLNAVCRSEGLNFTQQPSMHFSGALESLSVCGSSAAGTAEETPETAFPPAVSSVSSRGVGLASQGLKGQEPRHPAEAATAPAAAAAAAAAPNSKASAARGAAAAVAAATAPAPAAAAEMPGRRPGRPKKTRERRRGARETTDCPVQGDASAPDEDTDKMTISLLRESLTLMLDDLLDLCSPRLRSALTPNQRNKFYGPLKEHAKHIRETKDITDLVEYMRLYFDRYMAEKIVPSEDSSYARVFALLNALAAWPPPVAGCMRYGAACKAVNLGSDTSGGADLLEDILSDRSSSLGTDAEAHQPPAEREKPPYKTARQRAAKKRRFF